MSECLDIDKFMDEIHLRPAIWDSMSNESSNKQLKNKAWEELCYIFFENFDKKRHPKKMIVVRIHCFINIVLFKYILV